MTSVATAPPPARPAPDADVAALLAPGEEVRWSARPRPYVFMLRGIPNIAYGVTWGVLGAFWYRGTGGIGKYSAFDGWWRLTPLFSVPFILAGFSFFLYPIRLGARARRTWYIVTDRRVFVAEIPRDKPPQIRVFTSDEIAALNVRPPLRRPPRHHLFAPRARQPPPPAPAGGRLFRNHERRRGGRGHRCASRSRVAAGPPGQQAYTPR